MKYGDSDDYRHLPLDPHFHLTDHQKIVELQARREYEGFGEFPAVVGWQYPGYRDQLRDAPNVIGVSVWCQTGGWTRRLGFLQPSGCRAAAGGRGTGPRSALPARHVRDPGGGTPLLLRGLPARDPVHYQVHLDFRPARLRSAHLHRLLQLLLRRRRGYRFVDRWLTVRLLGVLHPLLRPVSRRFAPEVVHETAMGLEAILR